MSGVGCGGRFTTEGREAEVERVNHSFSLIATNFRAEMARIRTMRLISDEQTEE